MNGIHMIIQYCNDPRPQRQAEFDECLRRNLAHPVIVAIKNSPVNGASAIGCGLRNPSRTRRTGFGWRKSSGGRAGNFWDAYEFFVTLVKPTSDRRPAAKKPSLL